MLPAAFEMYDDVPKSIVEPKHRLLIDYLKVWRNRRVAAINKSAVRSRPHRWNVHKFLIGTCDIDMLAAKVIRSGCLVYE